MFRFLFNSAMRALGYAHEIRGLVTSRDVRFNSSRFYDARRRRLLPNAILAACITFFLGFISPNDAAADQTLVTDIYIAMPPAEEKLDGKLINIVFFQGVFMSAIGGKAEVEGGEKGTLAAATICPACYIWVGRA